MNSQGSKNEKREWVEPTLTHINAAETLGGTILHNPESQVFTDINQNTFKGVSA